MAEAMAIADPAAIRAPRIPPHILWPGIVIGLICMSLGVCGTTIYLAVSDPHFAVEPDYYEKGLRWDDQAAQLRRNTALGWSIVIDVPAAADARGSREVQIHLSDRQGVALGGATISIEAFSHLYSGERTRVIAAPTEQGLYSAVIPLRQPGTWEFRVTIERGPDTYARVFEVDVPSPTP